MISVEEARGRILDGLRPTPVEVVALAEAWNRVAAQNVAARLTPGNLRAAIELASLPAQIRGYGHVKEANVANVRTLEATVLKKFD